jgi:ABC-2 type transport system ATP-binding protein/bacitracin transport system ATP-binding protein
MEYIIETENLTKKYGIATVVRNVNIHLPKGKIYGLLGRNGAGKTTAMKMILQLVRPTTGTIKLFGSDYREDQKRLYSKIGSIIENPGFYHNLTAYENLELLERLRGLSNSQEDHNKCDKIKALEIVGLDKERTKPFADYSLGMKQRLGIAAAIMHNPELLILDEPINGLDPIGISEIRLLLSELSKKRGTTILISSHVLSEIEHIADIIGVMHEGQLIEEVNMEELNKRKRRYLEYEVSNSMEAVKLLENRYQITGYSALGNTIKVYDCTKNCGEINKTFIENGILVTKVNQCEENLEEYFSELIGGGGIA